MNSLHSPSPPQHVSTDRVEEFVRLIALHHKRIRHYVSCLVLNPNDADDVFQETQLVLWREFATFESGTNFLSWSCTVAFHQVLAWRKKRQRDRLVMSEEFLQAVSNELIEEADRLEERNRLLNACMKRLPSHHRELLRLRYIEGGAIEAIAAGMNRTSDAVYRMLSRIRQTLFDCVHHSLAGVKS